MRTGRWPLMGERRQKIVEGRITKRLPLYPRAVRSDGPEHAIEGFGGFRSFYGCDFIRNFDWP